LRGMGKLRPKIKPRISVWRKLSYIFIGPDWGNTENPAAVENRKSHRKTEIMGWLSEI
jgi:hypothetical protein